MKSFVVFFLFFSSFIFAQDKSFWIKDGRMEHDGLTRYFDVFVPSVLKANPELVIQLHGGTQSKDELYDKNSGASRMWKEVAEKNSFLLIVPNGTNLKTGKADGQSLNWNDCRMPIKNEKQADDVGFISKIIDWSIQKYNTDPYKTFITGVSNGGFMSYRLALEIPNKITAIAAFVANFPSETECVPTSMYVPTAAIIPVMIVNGTKDSFIPFDGGITSFKKESILSSQETVNFWIKNNKIASIKPQVIPILDISKKDKSTVVQYLYGSGDKKVSYYVVTGGGHTMPGKKYVLPKIIQKIVGKQNQDIEGAEIAWDFFKGISK
jgi:polyhydroxybutyrate depolymerase